jgi:hypothetical protein
MRGFQPLPNIKLPTPPEREGSGEKSVLNLFSSLSPSGNAKTIKKRGKKRAKGRKEGGGFIPPLPSSPPSL